MSMATSHSLSTIRKYSLVHSWQVTYLCDGKRLILVLLIQAKNARYQARKVFLESCRWQYKRHVSQGLDNCQPELQLHTQDSFSMTLSLLYHLHMIWYSSQIFNVLYKISKLKIKLMRNKITANESASMPNHQNIRFCCEISIHVLTY